MNGEHQNRHAEPADWQNDSRLAGMEKRKLRFLSGYAGRIQESTRAGLIPLLLSLNGEAQKQGIRFTDAETRLIVSVLTENMSPAQKQRARALQQIARLLEH